MCFEATQCTHGTCDAETSMECVFGECTCGDGSVLTNFIFSIKFQYKLPTLVNMMFAKKHYICRKKTLFHVVKSV